MANLGSHVVKNVLRHNQLQNGVHEFIFLTDKRESIDCFFDALGELFEWSPKNQEIRYIIDWTQSGVPSLNYTFLKTKEWGRKHPYVARGRCVVLFDRRGFLPVGKALASLVMRDARGRVAIRMEHVKKRDQALEWLMGEEEATMIAGV